MRASVGRGPDKGLTCKSNGPPLHVYVYFSRSMCVFTYVFIILKDVLVSPFTLDEGIPRGVMRAVSWNRARRQAGLISLALQACNVFVV